MKKLSALLIILIFTITFSFGQEAIYAIVQNDSVTIWHVETERNCAYKYKMEFEINDNKINLFEVDTGASANCLCYFDLSATLTNLLPGYYEVDVFSFRQTFNDTTFWGSTSFSILSGDGIPQLFSYTQSPCYDLTSVENQRSINTIKIYPIPAEKYIYVETKTDEFQVQIKNILGQIVVEEESVENKKKIDLSEIHAGIYFITVIAPGKKVMKKFIRL